MDALQRHVTKHILRLMLLLLHQWRHAEWLALHSPMLTEKPPDLVLADGLLYLDEACTQVCPERRHWLSVAALYLSKFCDLFEVLSCSMVVCLCIGCHMGIWLLVKDR